jgi:hypothetical protein
MWLVRIPAKRRKIIVGAVYIGFGKRLIYELLGIATSTGRSLNYDWHQQ